MIMDHLADVETAEARAQRIAAFIRRARLDASGNQIHRQARIRQAEAATADGAASH